MASGKSVVALIKALKPAFRSGNDNDKVALAVHAYFLASGYDLTATGPHAFSPAALKSSSTDEVGIDGWNELEDQYAFVYVNLEEGSKKVRVKCLVMEHKLHVFCALADGSSKHVELDVGNYVQETGGGNYSRQFKNMELLVKILDSLHPLSSETSESRCETSIRTEPAPQTHLSGRKRKQLDTLWEENKIPVNATNIASAGSVKVGKLEEEKVSVRNVYSTRRVKQKMGSGSDEAVGLGLLLEDQAIHDKKPQDFPKTAANVPIAIPKSQPTPASQSGSVPVTQEFHLLTDQILPTPVKKMSTRHLQDGEVYQGEA
ncbi:hypothetical protein C1H46_022668 [Malus baccata]|uniref:PI31 proteasome regulator N-terminal domain-containing protein n=1 Tax=Malus baccata TaxID=106549 RepID=A0A540LZI6_MALBA|nr:hypothetical protein C1H46_022668 [Malus baccata]